MINGMAKQAHQKTLSSQKGDFVIEQRSMFDDSLLPPAEELARLKEINPDIVTWIMEKASLEQNNRHLRTKEGIEMTRLEYRGSRRYNIAALTFAFVVIISGLSFSTFLIYNSMDIVGTIFAGGTLIMAANAFIKASKKAGGS